MGLIRAGWERLLKACPHCECARVRRSRRRNLGERLISWCGLYPFKCSDCERRFFLLAR